MPRRKAGEPAPKLAEVVYLDDLRAERLAAKASHVCTVWVDDEPIKQNDVVLIRRERGGYEFTVATGDADREGYVRLLARGLSSDVDTIGRVVLVELAE
jgi:hypothetical protein